METDLEVGKGYSRFDGVLHEVLQEEVILSDSLHGQDEVVTKSEAILQRLPYFLKAKTSKRRERERETEKERETERDKERKRERERDKEREKEKQR